MDSIFKQWEARLAAFESSVEKDLAEIRRSKAEMQQLHTDLLAEMQNGRYLRDERRIVLSAPEIVIGNVDRSGALYGAGSTVIIRGGLVGVEAAGEGGQVSLRAASIRQTAEDPGIDGREHVVGALSEVVSQARNVILQSNDTDGAFSAPTIPVNGSGVHIHADKTIDLDAAMTAESREQQLTTLIADVEQRKNYLKQEASNHKKVFQAMVKQLEKLMDKREKLLGSDDSDDFSDVRTNYGDIVGIGQRIETLSLSITETTYAYAQTLSMLAETCRQLKCFKDEKSKIKKGDAFTKSTTGAGVNITGETIRLTSADGENNLRDNEGAGILMTANEVVVASVEADGKLKAEGRVSVRAKNIDVATAGTADAQYDDKGVLEKATHTAEGDFTLRSKNITIEGADYEVADKKLKEKQLTADSKLRLRAKTIEVSTEGSANVEVDDKGKLTKANYTSEGDITVRSKTFTLAGTDNDLQDGKLKEKALTAGSQVSIRAEKMDLSATDTEGKATGSLAVNAKAVAVKSMDVEKEKRTDDKLAAGSTMTIVAEKLFVGAKSKDVKSKKVQVQSDEIGAFADKTLEVQQNDGKALVQLSGGNISLGGSKTALFGATTINAKTEVKDELKAPKATIDNLEAKTSFKSTNISDGIAIPAPPSTAQLSAKLKTEDAPK